MFPILRVVRRISSLNCCISIWHRYKIFSPHHSICFVVDLGAIGARTGYMSYDKINVTCCIDKFQKGQRWGFFFLDISVISVTYAINYIIKHRCLACGQCKNATWWRGGRNHGPVSISYKTSYRKITWSLEAASFVIRIVQSLCNLTGTSAPPLPMCQSNFKAMRRFKLPISWLRNFTGSYDGTPYRITMTS